MDHSIRLMPRWKVEMTFSDGHAHKVEAYGKTGEEAVYHAMRALKPTGLLYHWAAEPAEEKQA